MENQIVVFELGSGHFGIEIAKVESIIKMQGITQLPHVPSFVEGVTNLRGRCCQLLTCANALACVQKRQIRAAGLSL